MTRYFLVPSGRRRRHKRVASIAIAAALLVGGAGMVASPAAAKDAPTLTPPMGWNSWNKFKCDVTEEKVKEVARALVASGMRDAGYRTVTVDDCWMASTRDANNRLQPDPDFPSGMKALGDYLHNLGFKYGLYSSPTELTCQSRPGSYGYEKLDAQTFASWGVDFLKYDWCKEEPKDSPKMWAANPGLTQEQLGKKLFTLMSDELKATDREITYSISACCTYLDFPSWAGSVADLWRTGSDIYPNWARMFNTNYSPNVRHPGAAGPGHWNDPDMLEVGNGFSEVESKTHLALWALMAAPLIAGNDVAIMTDADRQLLTNKTVIKIDQDALGTPAKLVLDANGIHALTRQLVNGQRAVGVMNTTTTSKTVTIPLDQLGLASPVTLADVWSGATTSVTGSWTVTLAPHATAFVTGAGRSGGATFPGAGTYVLGALHSGQVMNVRNNSYDNGGAVVQWTKGWAISDDGNDKWIAKPATGGTFTLVGVNSQKCLDVPWSSTADSVKLHQWTCSGGANQRWSILPTGESTFKIVSALSGKCVDIPNWTMEKNTQLEQYTCNGGTNQSWVIKKVG